MIQMSPEIAQAAKTMREYFPSLFMRLNTAQYRALEDMYTLTPDGRLPDLNSIEFANGVGKSHLMIIVMVGVTMGPEYLGIADYPDCAVAYWTGLKAKRDAGKLSLRLVCTADDMKAGGSVYELLKAVFPWAKPASKDNNEVFRQIDVPHPSLLGIKNSFAVKTFDQKEDKHSGSTCDLVLINENLPENLTGETLARTRGGGNIVQFATILDYSSQLDELENGERFIMCRTKGHIYENCIGSQVTDEMAAEVFEEIGIMLEKDSKGGYKTGGVLQKSKIDAMIEGWARSCPHQLKARKTGKPISSGGKIHEAFNETVHVKSSAYLKKIPALYPVVQIVDPHPARPDASIWGIVLPTNRLHIFREWPTVDGFGFYEQIKEKRFTISQKCDIWKKIEADEGFADQVVARVGDPNSFKAPNTETEGQLSDLYEEQGFDFDLSVRDSLEFGFEKVNEYLYYDQMLYRFHPEDPASQARLTFSENCRNINRAMKNFARKANRDRTAPVSSLVDEKFGCFAGCVRYFVVWHADNPFNTLTMARAAKSDDDRIQAGRIPNRFRRAETSINLHGRQLVGVK
jgi:hypothetical protein